jgi:DNA-directed RNA polymerase subunit beta'
MYQCGIPKEMALELFKPHVINGLVSKEIANNIKSAKKMIDARDPKVWDVVEEIIKEHPVMLNRAPTLHRLGIQAFEPKLVSGKAIRLHPLVTTAFNADFDGDQMAVHVPLSEEAKAEARILMLGANNILSPKDGKPIVTPSQDMILGNYYITMEKPGHEGEGRIFKNSNEALMAYNRREVDLHTRIVVPVNSFKHKVFLDSHKNQYLVTTVGKLIFNEILPDSFPYVNEPTDENIEKYTPNKYFIAPGENIPEKIKEIPKADAFKKGTLEKIIAQMFKKYKTTETSIMLDKLKDLGFKYSTYSGITIAASDVVTSKNKDAIIEASEAEVKKINKQYQRGLITDKERFDLVIAIWDKAKKDIEKELESYAKSEEYEDNPIFIMMNSKARGSISNFVQLAGMRGTMAKPNGEPVEIPIKSSFRDGLSVSEFFLSTHGARKGSADTALKTADSGYMTRRLVDVAQDLIVREEDCGTTEGVVVSAFKDDKDGIIEPLYDRILGRFTNKKVINPETKEVIVDKNELITENIAEKIIAAGIESVEIRTVLTCRTDHGVCCKCYGRNLATGNVVEIGEAVGTMGAQSIGEPGTQLTMRTFHTGGVAGGEDITQGLPRVEELFEARTPKGKALIAEIDGTVSKIEDVKGRTKIYIKNANEVREHLTAYGAKLRVEKGDKVVAGDRLTEGNVSPKELLMVTDPNTVQQYILKEVQKVYRSQGVDINDKHVELIARRMISQIRILDSGDTDFLPSTVVSINKFAAGNRDVILQGKKPAIGQPILLGITKSSLQTDSFLASASFQETTRILTEAAVKGKTDYLHGLKENVIIGKLIPAGTGAKEYMDIGYTLEKEFFDDEPAEVLEEKFLD